MSLRALAFPKNTGTTLAPPVICQANQAGVVSGGMLFAEDEAGEATPRI